MDICLSFIGYCSMCRKYKSIHDVIIEENEKAKLYRFFMDVGMQRQRRIIGEDRRRYLTKRGER